MVSVVSDQTEISYAETVTNWSGDSFVLETQILVQGSNSVAVIQTGNGINDVIYTGGAWNMSGKHLRMYMSSNIMPNTKTEALNGIQIFASDGTNTAYWTVGGSDTYSGGWRDFFVDIDSIPTSGSVSSIAVTSVGIRINTSSKPRNSTNGWYDNWRFGNGLEINSSTTELISFTDVAINDELVTNQYDIIQDTDGVLFAKGSLTLGNSAGALNCNLQSVNETIYFVDRVVSSSLYGIISSKGSGTTDIDIQGLTCKTVGNSGAELDFSVPVTSFSLIGSSFSNMGAISFSAGTLNSTKFTSCGTISIPDSMTGDSLTILSSGQITLNTSGLLTNSSIANTSATSAVIATTLSNISGCQFDSTAVSSHAVELTSIGGGTMSWDNSLTGYETGASVSPVTPTSTGNEAIYVNVASGTLTINVTDTATVPSVRSAGAIVNVVAGQKTFGFTVSPAITGYEWRLYEDTATPGVIGTIELAGEEVSATTDHLAAYTYSYSSDTNIVLQVIASGYEESVSYTSLTNTDSAISVNLQIENNT